MANEQNLKPFKKGEYTCEMAKKNGALGGKKKAENKKQEK